MQKFSCLFFFLAIVSIIFQKLFFNSKYISYDETNIISERILVISIHKYKDDWEYEVRKILDASVYKENISICVIIICNKKRSPFSIPIDLQSKVFITYTRSRNKDFISTSIKKVHNNEEYVCVFRNCSPYMNWDVNCLNFINRKTILTATPSLNEAPTFSTIKNNKGMLENGSLKKFHSVRKKVTPTSCICSNFIFAHSENILNIDFSNPMIHESMNTFKKIMTPCFAIVSGKYLPSEHVYDKEKKYHSNMKVGLSENPLDNECIVKYGSVETAELQVEFSK